MATTDGKTYKLVASVTNQNTSALATVTNEFRLTSGVVLPSVTTTFHRGTDESGRATDLEQTAPVPVAKDLTWGGISMVADDYSVPFWMYWASHGGDANGSAAGNATPGTLNTIGITAHKEHYWHGPQTDGTFRAVTIEAQGTPDGTDGDLNRSIHNCVVEQFELTGQRKGKYDVNLTLRGGGAVAEQTAPTSGTFTRNHVYNFGMTHLLTSPSLGFLEDNGSSDGTDDVFGAQITETTVVTHTQLNAGGAPDTMTAPLQSVALRFNQTPDPVRSYAPGSLDANDAGIVPSSTDWIPSDSGSATAELEMVFTQTGNATVENLMEEYEAGTRRAWELWIAPDQPTVTDAYSGVRVTFGEMHPVSWEEVANGFGAKDVRVVYRAGYTTTGAGTDCGWLIGVGWANDTVVGLDAV